ncbi:response regulator transcription factor [Sphingomonas sp. BIUV-7]|uniref:Response regulator transcription factor n=1 Tax=Sphingomonas natans TaxID=3063330 RepID=A0ABT8YCY8_9SPHN|nr:response regulator transcription factor [Sphingomonas sp. BIUV-7]MDO6416186.1 response regulator transcription factor [Sphingomonas sp. BIUV-7]
MDKLIQVALIVPNEITREGLSHILGERDFEVVAAAACIDELVASSTEKASVVVMAIGERDDLARACAELAAAFPQARRVLTAADFGLDDMIFAYEQEIDGLILNGVSSDQFAGALRLVFLGERVLPARLADYLIGRVKSERSGLPETIQSTSGLSQREVDILGHLVDGEANKVIARQLNIAEATVKVHIKTILRKLRLNNRTQAAIWAARNQVGAAAIVQIGSAACF